MSQIHLDVDHHDGKQTGSPHEQTNRTSGYVPIVSMLDRTLEQIGGLLSQHHISEVFNYRYNLHICCRPLSPFWLAKPCTGWKRPA